MDIKWLGRVPYAKALELQNDLVAAKASGSETGDQVLLLEHEPVYTIGRTPDQSSLPHEKVLPYPVLQINRGGQATYHGPGQLVGYPILDLRKRGQDLHQYLRTLEELLIEMLAQYGLKAVRRTGLTGVWIADRKIASIGVGIRHWISMHGFALNVRGDLAPFQSIVPCGIAGVQMTSMERELGKSPDVQSVADGFAAIWQTRFEKLLPVTAC